MTCFGPCATALEQCLWRLCGARALLLSLLLPTFMVHPGIPERLGATLRVVVSEATSA